MSDFTQDFLTSRRNFADGNTRIGEEGRLWYDSITNTIRISDGITPGGIIVLGGGGSGVSGYSGYSGYSGQSLSVQGTVLNYTLLPTYAPPGSIYIIQEAGGGYEANSGAISDGAEPVSNWINLGPIMGISGYSGYSGASGQAGEQGISGYSGASGQAGEQGISGYSGFSGQSGDNNLIWTENGVYRTLTSFRNDDDTVSSIRVAEFSNNLLRLTLASFTPTLTTTITPLPPLNWDVPVTAFTVNITNPDDIPNEYITDVSYITVTSGFISDLIDFSAGPKSAVPGPGVDWTQTFSTGATGYIRSNSVSIAGGTATANIVFKYWNGSSETNFLGGNAPLSVTWNTPTMAVTLAALTGATFLQTYTSTTYNIAITGMASSANFSNSVTSIGGTISNPVGNGTFTFTDPIHKNNTATTRTVSNATTFTRPSAVTGMSYIATLNSTTPSATGTFSYPSLWVFTISTFDVPTRSSYISGSGFAAGVTVLGNQVKVINGYIINPFTEPKGFWFAVRTSASQPTQFKTGVSPSLLSDVTVVTGNTVLLSPDVIPSGYVAESYTLYGITLQVGSTYVSIS